MSGLGDPEPVYVRQTPNRRHKNKDNMEYSGNIEADMKDNQRELDYKFHSILICPICNKTAKEDNWNYGYEICDNCFADHQEEINYKHRER